LDSARFIWTKPVFLKPSAPHFLGFTVIRDSPYLSGMPSSFPLSPFDILHGRRDYVNKTEQKYLRFFLFIEDWKLLFSSFPAYT